MAKNAGRDFVLEVESGVEVGDGDGLAAKILTLEWGR